MQAFMNSLSPGYFETMGIPVLEGRDFDRRDIKEDSKVVIVNRQFADHYFGERSAVGRHLGRGGPDAELNREIVGVVENTLYEGPREGVRRQVFVPNWGNGGVAFYLRTAMGSAAAHAAARREVKTLDASMPVFEMKTLASQLDETLTTERLVAMLSASFGLLATLLAMIGLYGVMAFSVARRTKELGLRMALGAQRGAVIWLVMREVLLLLGIGLAIGIPAGLGLGRFVSSQLYGMEGSDPWFATVAVVLLVVVSSAAGLIPAQRASRINPILALRYE
jgi:predicted permease